MWKEKRKRKRNIYFFLRTFKWLRSRRAQQIQSFVKNTQTVTTHMDQFLDVGVIVMGKCESKLINKLRISILVDNVDMREHVLGCWQRWQNILFGKQRKLHSLKPNGRAGYCERQKHLKICKTRSWKLNKYECGRFQFLLCLFKQKSAHFGQLIAGFREFTSTKIKMCDARIPVLRNCWNCGLCSDVVMMTANDGVKWQSMSAADNSLKNGWKQVWTSSIHNKQMHPGWEAERLLKTSNKRDTMACTDSVFERSDSFSGRKIKQHKITIF